MKYLVLSILMLSAPLSFAATSASNFAGQYSLESENTLGKNQQPICSQGLIVAFNGKNVNVVSATFNATAELNGPAVKLVDSTREGDLKVGFAQDQLTISIKGVFPEYIVPGDVEFNETITLEQTSVAGKFNVHHVFSSALAEFNADSECVYVKN